MDIKCKWDKGKNTTKMSNEKLSPCEPKKIKNWDLIQ